MKCFLLLTALLGFEPLEENLFEELEQIHNTYCCEELIPSAVRCQELLESVHRFKKQEYRVIIDQEICYYLPRGRRFLPIRPAVYMPYVTEGSTVVDYKAENGIHSLYLAQLVGERGVVVAFEENPKEYRELFWNFTLNELENGKLYPYYPNDKKKTLDQLGLQNVSLIRINMGRDETPFFQGATHTILRDKPYLIIKFLGGIPTEWSDKYLKQAFTSQLEYIRCLGYATKQIGESEYLAYFP